MAAMATTKDGIVGRPPWAAAGPWPTCRTFRNSPGRPRGAAPPFQRSDL